MVGRVQWWGELTAGLISQFEERAQSEVIGAMLLTAVIIIVMMTAAVFVFDEVTGEEDQVLADIDHEVTADEITLKHNSGDTFDSADITVRTIGDIEETLTLDDDFTNGESFSPGSSWNTETNAFNGDDGQAGTLLVIHEPTNTVLLSESFVIGEPEDDEDEDEDVDGFNIEILETNSPVEEGETIEVEVNVTNTGEEQDSQTLTLDIEGEENADSENVNNLDPGVSETIILDWDDTADAGTYTANVSSEDDSEEIDVEVEAKPAVLEVDDFSIEDKDSDETFTVDITVEETEDIETENLEITLEVEDSDGDSEYSETFDAEAIQDDDVTVTFGEDGETDELGEFEPGEYTATATANADNADEATATEQFQVDVDDGEADEVSLDEQSVDSINGNDGIEFALNNGGVDDVTIIGIAFTAASDESESIDDMEGDGTFRSDGTELFDGAIELGGDFDDLDSDVTIDAESAQDFELGQFRDDEGETVNTNQGEYTIELKFVDESILEVTLDP